VIEDAVVFTCPCLWPDVDPDEQTNPDGLCDCGHAVDEHDPNDGHCLIEVSEV